MKFGKIMLALTMALSLTMGAWAQEKTEKKLKKAGEVEKKTSDAAEKKAAPVQKKADAVEKKAASTEKKAAAKTAAAYAGGIVNINTATKTQLMELPGVGEANADHIIKGRPYKSTDELISRKIVQQRYYDDFKKYVTAK